MNNLYQIPALNRLSAAESKAIKSMFTMYDLKSTGKISPHYARKLLVALGFDAEIVDLPFNVTLGEFLFIVDTQAPHPSPSLPVRTYISCRLYTFINFSLYSFMYIKR